MTDVTTSTKTVKTSGKAAHLAACAAAKIEGDARRAQKKADRATAHQALLATRKSDAAQAKADRIAGHVARNQDAKAKALEAKAANDQAVDADVAA